MTVKQPVDDAFGPIIGVAILHPVCLLSVAALLVNDHWAKQAFPGWWTGKISDLAGMVFFPVFLHSVWQLGRRLSGRALVGSRKTLRTCALATGVVFAAINLVPEIGFLYAWAAGVLQWPFRVLIALPTGEVPRAWPVAHTVDPTDLLALPALLVAYAVGSSTLPEGSARDQVSLVSVVLDPEA